MRRIKSAKLKRTEFPRLAIALRLAGFLLLLSGHLLSAQYVPIVSGAVGFFDSKNTGINFFQPVVAPVVVAPLGKHFLATAAPTRAPSWGQPNISSWTISQRTD
jgi:Na+/H+-dicarboxylate symporter